MVQVRKPEVLVMGSSKVRFMRAGFFKKPDIFYNSQLGGDVIEDYSIMLNKIPVSAQPKVILWGINSEYFDSSCRVTDINTLGQEYSQEYAKDNPLRVWQYAYRQ